MKNLLPHTCSKPCALGNVNTSLHKNTEIPPPDHQIHDISATLVNSRWIATKPVAQVSAYTSSLESPDSLGIDLGQLCNNIMVAESARMFLHCGLGNHFSAQEARV